jgi:mono/diheme cytochrome c family protein
MNTSKQVNAMIGLLGLLVIILAAYTINEGNRQAAAREEILERNLHRGAKMFVANCRGCHGMEGNGTEEGAIGAQLRRDSFLIFDEHNKDFAATPAGEADELRAFLRNTISCGRTGSPMPPWSDRYGGPLSDTKVDQLVTFLTTPGAWDIYDEVQDEHLKETFPKLSRDEAYATEKGTTVVQIKDLSTLTLTESNCGQYTGTAAAKFRIRDPFVPKGAEETKAEGGATPKAKASGPQVKGLAVADFFKANCAACHGASRQGGVGPALTPERLTNTDDFYANTIANGRAGTAMPAWKTVASLSDDDISNLVTFIKTVKP